MFYIYIKPNQTTHPKKNLGFLPNYEHFLIIFAVLNLP